MERFACLSLIVVLLLEIIRLRFKCCQLPHKTESIIAKLLKGRSVILVGNGPSILNRKNGRRIDSFDVIVRFNGFRIKKAYTGAKTTIHVQSEVSMLTNVFREGMLLLLNPKLEYYSKIHCH